MKKFSEYAKQGNYKKHIFGVEVIEYLQKCCQDGTSLGIYIEKYIDFSKGETVTLVDKNIQHDRLLEFNYGGKISVPQELLSQYKQTNITPKLDTTFWIVEEIKKQLLSNKSCFMYSSILQSPTDSYLLEKGAKKERILIIDNKEIYYFYDQKDLDRGRITPDFIGNTPWATVLGITTIPNGKDYKIGMQNITSEDLLFFVQNIKQIIFNVYDGESYLIWTKS